MVMVVGAVSAVDIGDIMGDFSDHRITCGRMKKMDAVEFFEEHDRMRKSFGGDCRKKYWLEEVEG